MKLGTVAKEVTLYDDS